MSAKSVELRPAAIDDIDEALAYCQREGGFVLVDRWIDTFEAAIGDIGRHPGRGSTRYAELLRTPGLRCVPVEKFPFLVFYVEHPELVDVWRVLQAERDVPESLQGE